MDNISYNSHDSFKEMLEGLKEGKEIIEELLEKVLNTQIKSIEFAGTEHFDTITEYDFSLFKIKLICQDNIQKEVYLKMIKGGKIKESIFCYWSLLYEEYLKNNVEREETMPPKAIITQTTANESTSSIVLTLNPKLNYYAEINFIELRKFAIDRNDTKLERWLNNLEISDEDILFIGRKRVLKNI